MINRTLQPFSYFNAFTWATPTIPDIYWNAYSYEERIKNLCMEYGKLIAYVNAMADTVNAQYESIKSIEDNLPQTIADAIDNSDEAKQIIKDAVNKYIDSLIVAQTYGDLKQFGFVCNKGVS